MALPRGPQKQPLSGKDAQRCGSASFGQRWPSALGQMPEVLVTKGAFLGPPIDLAMGTKIRSSASGCRERASKGPGRGRISLPCRMPSSCLAHGQFVFPEGWDVANVDPNEVPHHWNLEQADYILVVGQPGSVDWANQLAGLIRRYIEGGAVLIVAYDVFIEGAVEVILQRFGIEAERLAEAAPVEAVEESFAEYFDVFGRSGSKVRDPDLEVLGRAGNAIREMFSPSVVRTRGAGAIYLVPFYFGGAQQDFMRLLLGAVESHRRDAGDTIPTFLRDLRLPQEAEVLDEIVAVKANLGELTERAKKLERYRLLLGTRGTGQALEELVIEALNLLLADTDYHAEDREDVGVEDFWIVGADGDFALAEVKGTNTNVKRQDVNQVDNHREMAGRDPEFPGLLVSNIFRGHTNLADRQQEVPEHAMIRATASNVLILRTVDLYNLVGRKMAGSDSGRELLDALAAGGGWLAVDEHGAQLHQREGPGGGPSA
jgi:hypothetical protein